MNPSDIKRVGIVCPYSFVRPGGVQNHVLGMAGWLKKQGYTVGILAPGFPEQELLDLYGVDEADFTSAGRTVPIKINGSVARVNFSPRAAMAAYRWLKKGQWDVVHVHEPITPTLSLLTLWLADAPVTGTFHSASPIYKALRAFNQMLPKSISRLNSAIAVSSLAAEVANAHTGIEPVVIGNGLEIDDYTLAATEGEWRGGDRPLITFLGRYTEPRKGFQVLTAALPLIREKYPDLRCVVMGHGPVTSIPGVEFVGGVSDAERNEWLMRSDAYIAPQTGRESFGIVLIEALACGAPVVASDLRAFIDVLSDEDGICGHVFQAGNPQALADAVLASLEEPRDLRLQRGRKVAARYDWSAIGPQVISMYELAKSRRERLHPKKPN